jgi:sodium/potassium/calcium exchanger 6
MMGDTAESYFTPTLLKISKYIHLSENAAGVTLLALGNGSPDLSAIIMGVLSQKPGFAIGAPIGGGLFVTTVVLGLVILSTDVVVSGVPFIRDVMFYLISVCYIFFLVSDVYLK